METSNSVLSSGVAAAYMLSMRMLATAAIITVGGALMARWEGGAYQTTFTRLNNLIFIPCLVFASMNRTPITASEALTMVGGAVMFALFSYPLARVWVSDDPSGSLSGYIPILFGSTSTLLLPLSYLMFGSHGLAKATFFHLANLLMIYTCGLRSSGQSSRLSDFLKTPALHAVLLAILLKLLDLELPHQVQELLWLVEKGIGMMAAGAVPVLLMSHGYALYALRHSGASYWSGGAVMRAIYFPIVAILVIIVLRRAGIAPLEKGYDLIRYLDLRTAEAILLLASAMPCTVSVLRQSPDAATSGRTDSLILSSSIISVVISALILFVANRYIFTA